MFFARLHLRSLLSAYDLEYTVKVYIRLAYDDIAAGRSCVIVSARLFI